MFDDDEITADDAIARLPLFETVNEDWLEVTVDVPDDDEAVAA